MENKKLNDSQIRGIELSMKALKKIFPFIKSWELSNGWDKYETHIYINLHLSYVGIEKLFDLEMSKSFKRRIENGELIQTSSILAPFDWGDYGTEEFKKIGDLSYNFGRKINDTLNQAYEYVPDEMRIYWKASSGNKYESKLSIDSYFYQL